MELLWKSKIIEIECPVAVGPSQVRFPDQPDLHNVPIKRIIVYTVDLVSKSPGLKTVMSIADMKKCYVTFQLAGDQVVQNKALLSFNETANPTNAYTNNPAYINRIFSWQKCLLNFADAITASSVVLEVWYDDRGVDTNTI